MKAESKSIWSRSGEKKQELNIPGSEIFFFWIFQIRLKKNCKLLKFILVDAAAKDDEIIRQC